MTVSQGRPWSASTLRGEATFRTGLRERGMGYVLAVAVDQHVTTAAGRGRADVLAAALPRRSWQQHCAGQGSKGPRDYDWA